MIRGELQVKRPLPGPLKIDAKRPDDAPLLTLDEMVTELKGKTVTNDLPVNPNTGLPYEPADNERLMYFDDWYSKCKSNSLTFCDADYLEMRARIRQDTAIIDALRSRLKLAEDVCEAAEIFLDDFLSHRSCAPGGLQTPINAWRSARDAKPKDEK